MSQPKSKVTLSLVTAITALSLGSSAYAQNAPSPPPEREVPPPTIDTDKDGKADAWDRDANGAPDAWDTNGDAKPDLFDNDGDGKPDEKAAKPAPRAER